MTANTPNRGYTYPQSTDHDRIWEHFQELATDLDTDITTLLTKATTTDPGAVQTNFTVWTNGAYAIKQFGVVHLWLDLNNANTLTATTTNIADVTAYIVDPAWCPNADTYLPSTVNTGATMGTAQLGPDGVVSLQSMGVTVSPGAHLRMYWTFVQA